MTAAVPLIHAFTVAMVTGIIVEQTGESEGKGRRGVGEGKREMRGNGEGKAKDDLKVCAGGRAVEKQTSGYN